MTSNQLKLIHELPYIEHAQCYDTGVPTLIYINRTLAERSTLTHKHNRLCCRTVGESYATSYMEVPYYTKVGVFISNPIFDRSYLGWLANLDPLIESERFDLSKH